MAPAISLRNQESGSSTAQLLEARRHRRCQPIHLSASLAAVCLVPAAIIRQWKKSGVTCRLLVRGSGRCCRSSRSHPALASPTVVGGEQAACAPGQRSFSQQQQECLTLRLEYSRKRGSCVHRPISPGALPPGRGWHWRTLRGCSARRRRCLRRGHSA